MEELNALSANFGLYIVEVQRGIRKGGKAIKYEGHISCKSAIEYNPDGGIFGEPYFIITSQGDQIDFYEP